VAPETTAFGAGTSAGTRRWAVASSVGAPIALIGGWTLAAHLQPAGFDPVRQTISALAAHGARDRLAMTTGLYLLGLCHLATAAGLRPAAMRGRAVLAVGGIGTISVAAFPQPQGGSSTGHTTSATVAFIALACWPLLAARPSGPPVLSVRTSIAAAATMVALLLWFFLALSGPQAGLAERFLAGTQALWPLVVVLATVSYRRGPKRQHSSAE
jgi:hypothetical membrane protein